jgi:DNA-directed RNA polymerase subunit RPC12/RpoP
MSVICAKCKKEIEGNGYIRIFYPTPRSNIDTEMILCLTCSNEFQSYLRSKIVAVRHYTEKDIDTYVANWLAGE